MMAIMNFVELEQKGRVPKHKSDEEYERWYTYKED